MFFFFEKKKNKVNSVTECKRIEMNLTNKAFICKLGVSLYMCLKGLKMYLTLKSLFE
jgi:hypothetical protein